MPIVDVELELFGCVPQERYSFLFGRPQPGGFGGSPKTSSMTLFLSPELPVDFAISGLEHLIAHEFHHTWMRARCSPPDDLRFVAEGFTDYYSWIVPWRLGWHDDAELLGTLNGKLAEWEENAGPPLVQAGGPSFFEGGSDYAATYAGGLVVALLCDLAIRRHDEEGRTLDDFLRAFYEDPRWKEGRNPTRSDFLALLTAFAGEEHAERVESPDHHRGPTGTRGRLRRGRRRARAGRRPDAARPAREPRRRDGAGPVAGGDGRARRSRDGRRADRGQRRPGRERGRRAPRLAFAGRGPRGRRAEARGDRGSHRRAGPDPRSCTGCRTRWRIVCSSPTLAA